MVIEAISTKTVIDFGTLPSGNAASDRDPMTQLVFTLESDPFNNSWFFDTGHCVIKPVEGISIVCLSQTEDFSSVRCFLLDQEICLKPGIFFNFSALYGVSQVAVTTRQADLLRQVPTPLTWEAMASETRVAVGKVYTVLEQEKPPGFHFPGEKHGFWEMTLVLKGVLVHEVEGQQFETKPSQICLYASGKNHAQWSGTEEGVNFITVTFEMVEHPFSGFDYEIYESDEDISQLVMQIISEYIKAAYGSIGLVRCYLEIVLLLLLRRSRLERTLAGSTEEVKHRVESVAIIQLITRMNAQLSYKWTLADLAAIIYVSPSYLSILFKRELGETPMEWLNRRRMEEAVKLLVDEKLSVTACAELLGFASIHYFSRVFKQWYQQSPSEYVRLGRYK